MALASYLKLRRENRHQLGSSNANTSIGSMLHPFSPPQSPLTPYFDPLAGREAPNNISRGSVARGDLPDPATVAAIGSNGALFEAHQNRPFPGNSQNNTSVGKELFFNEMEPRSSLPIYSHPLPVGSRTPPGLRDTGAKSSEHGNDGVGDVDIDGDGNDEHSNDGFGNDFDIDDLILLDDRTGRSTGSGSGGLARPLEASPVNDSLPVDLSGKLERLDALDKSAHMTETDFKAMRLLVRTSLREKQQAQQRALDLERRIHEGRGELNRLSTSLNKLNATYVASSRWRLPVHVLLLALQRWCTLRLRLFHRWKAQVVGARMGSLQCAGRMAVLRQARRNLLKARALCMGRAFCTWRGCVAFLEGQDQAATRAVQLARRAHSLRRSLRAMHIHCQLPRRLGRMMMCMRTYTLRAGFSRWRHYHGIVGRTANLRLRQQLALQGAVAASVIAQAALRRCWKLWAAGTRRMGLELQLGQWACRKLQNAFKRHLSPTARAFAYWRAAAFGSWAKAQQALYVCERVLRKTHQFQKQRAFNRWRLRTSMFYSVVHRAALRLLHSGKQLQRQAFARWRRQLLHDSQQQLRSSIRRWRDQFLFARCLVDQRGSSAAVRSRFRQWALYTQAACMRAGLEQQLQASQGSHGKTQAALEDTQEARLALEEQLRAAVVAERRQAMTSTLRFLCRTLLRWVDGSRARAFRKWAELRHTALQEEATRRELLVRNHKLLATTILHLVRRYQGLSAAYAFRVWQTKVLRTSAQDTALAALRRRGVRRVFSAWMLRCHHRQLQRKMLTRLCRAASRDLKYLGWITWLRWDRRLREVQRLLGRCARWTLRRALWQWREVSQWESAHEGRQSLRLSRNTNLRLLVRIRLHAWKAWVSASKAHKRHLRGVLVSAFYGQRVGSYFSGWRARAREQTLLLRSCGAIFRSAGLTGGRAVLVAFSRWKGWVLRVHRDAVRDMQVQLSAATQQITSITQQQLVLEGDTAQLRRHNERADRVARLLYQQVGCLLDWGQKGRGGTGHERRGVFATITSSSLFFHIVRYFALAVVLVLLV